MGGGGGENGGAMAPGPSRFLPFGSWSRSKDQGALVPGSNKNQAMVPFPSAMVLGPWGHLANGSWSWDPHLESRWR